MTTLLSLHIRAIPARSLSFIWPSCPTSVMLRSHHISRYYYCLVVLLDMVVRCRVSGESSLVVKGTLNPPVSTLKVGHPIPPT